MAITHTFQVTFIRRDVTCEFGEDFVSTRFVPMFSARIVARGFGTASNAAAAMAPMDHTWEIRRVVDGIVSSKTMADENRDRAIRFGRR